MKRALFVVLELVIFLVVFLVGSILPGIHVLLPMMSVAAGPGRIFVLDGLLLAAAIYVVILLVSVARKRVRTAGMDATIAFVLAVLLGLAMKFGFLTQ
jgi:hypothetical protein